MINQVLPLETPAVPHEVATTPEAREATLRSLMPYDYDYAKDSGLVDLFYFNPETGEDGLLHTLAGNIVSDENGNYRVEGFHHEPSGAIVWPSVEAPGGEVQPVTRVDHTHLETLTSDARRDYREFPFEPHLGRVVVNGIRKYALRTDPRTGKKRLDPAKNSMFPQEYDALAVMQAVRIAYESRDTSKDKPSTNNRGEEVLVSDSRAPLIDGKTPMKIRLVIDKETGKIRTATPVVKSGGGVMKLTQAEIDQHVYGKEPAAAR